MSAYAEAQKQQRAAAEPETNVFVTANAGSGKTKVLVDRIARLLLAGAKPSAFLCITYTKAAAAEMQRRLFERLGDWCVADDKTLRKALAELEGVEPEWVKDADLPKARALFARALETPGGLKIQTIHAFCERLLARFPLEAGAPPGFDIADEARAADLMDEARGAICASEEEEVLAAFARFASRLNSDRLDLLLANLAGKSEQLSPGDLRKRHNVNDSPEEALAKAVGAIPWRDLNAAADALSASTSKDQDVAQSIREAAACADPRDQWNAYLCVFYTEKGLGDPRARIVTKGFADKQPHHAQVFVQETARVEAARANLRRADRAADAHAAHVIAAALARAYDAAKDRAGVLDFADLIAQARKLLSQSAAAPWVLFKLDGGVDHILIDEGQDTSPDQWKLIAPLQDEFFSGIGAQEKKRTVFAVGDPKQSIYSFQGADPDGFLNESHHLQTRAEAAGAPFVAPTLEMSFRSAPEILAAVDATFAETPLAAGEPEASNVVRHIARRADARGLVEWWPPAPKPAPASGDPWDAPLDMETGADAPTALARDLARKVKEWIAAGEAVSDKDGSLRPMQPGDVIALVRVRGQIFHALIKAFKRAGLPVAGADRMVLKNELAVEDCLALMRVALDPADDLSLACVLKGPWLNLTDDDRDLLPLAHGRGKGETLHARLMANADDHWSEARRFVGALGARAGLDAFAFLSWALEGMDRDGRTGWARVLSRLGAEARDPLEELLERALAPNPRAAPTLQRFLADMETDNAEVKRELEAAGGAIRVMTVHGAKGLEAPVVLLPDTTGGVKDAAEDGVLMEGDALFWSPRQGEDDEATRSARDAHKARAEREHWRLLYVAMTRARDRLIVCGYAQGNSGEPHAKSWHKLVGDSINALAQPCDTPFGEGLRIGAPLRAPPQTKGAAQIVTLPEWARRPLHAAGDARALAPSKLKAPAALSPRRDGETRFKRGVLIHGLLQRLPDLAPDARAQAAEAWLARQGVEAEARGPLANEALAVIAHPKFARAFGPESRAEAPLVGAVAGRPVRGIVDRLIVTADEVLVLDYKSDRPAPLAPEDAPAAYVLQMALYRSVLMQIFPDRVVRCALIWTERPALTELSAAQLTAALSEFSAAERR